MAPPDEPTTYAPLEILSREAKPSAPQADPNPEPLTPLQILEAIEKELSSAVRRVSTAREMLLRNPTPYVNRVGFALVDQVRDLELVKVELRNHRLSVKAHLEGAELGKVARGG